MAGCGQVWVGLAGHAALQEASEAPQVARKAQTSRRLRTGEDAAPPLPSLLLGRPTAAVPAAV